MLLVEWLDSKGVTSGWEYLDELEPMLPDRVVTVGILLEEAKDYKTLALAVGSTQVMGRITIPNCAIVTCRELRVK